MKLFVSGTKEEIRWFKGRVRCPYAMPCPRHKEYGTEEIDPEFSCKDCPWHMNSNREHDNVQFGDSPPPKSLADNLKDHCAQGCDKCIFNKDGTCQLDYHCPADLELDQ